MTQFLWPRSKKYNFEKRRLKYSKSKLNYIENFFSKKYNSKYCALTASGRIGIILSLNFKKFDKSKIVHIPKWSSSCLVNAVGSVSSINSTTNNSDCKILVHHLGQSFSINKVNSKCLLIDDSSDSLPSEQFIPCKKSKYSEIISLPKIIGSYAGGIVLTNNKYLYSFIKKQQDMNINMAHEQSFKKYKSMVLNSKNFDWHHYENINFSLDFNTVNNVYENLMFFDINRNVIKKRRKLFSKYNLYKDIYRLGPCLLFNLKKKYMSKFKIYHFNVTKNLDKQNYQKKIILPIHFGTDDNIIEEFYKQISKN